MIGATSENAIEKSVKCTAAVAAFTIAKFGADDDTLALATAVSDELLGVFQHATTVAGEEVRVQVTGITRVKLGGTVTRGGWATTDGSGQAVAAAPAAGVNNNVIGRFLASGVNGDIVPLLLSQNRIQG